MTLPPYASLFTAAGSKYRIDPAFLAAVARQESQFNPNAVNPKSGALGMMQIMPEVATYLRVNPMDPAQAVDGAARLLQQNLQKFGSFSLAAAAYNAGPGNVIKYGGIPPFTETQEYVRKVLIYQREFQDQGFGGTTTNWKTVAVASGVVLGAGSLAWWFKQRFL
jgi:peptidoglycan DL-endopeptidase CwlO